MQLKRIFTGTEYRGTRGYLRTQKTYEIIRTVLYFGVALSLFAAGWIQTGERVNLLTIVAILGCLPASKSAVSMIMFLRYQSLSEETAAKLSPHEEGLATLYDMVFTSQDQTYPVGHMTVHAGNIIAYAKEREETKKNSPKPSKEAFPQQKFTEHIQSMLKKSGYSNVGVKVFSNPEKYIERMEQLKELEDHPSTAGICEVLKSVVL